MNATTQVLSLQPSDAPSDPMRLPASATPMDMLLRAVSSGASIEVMEKLLALQERWEANQARRAFDAAVATAKAAIPIIGRNRKGHNDKQYADFSAYAKAVDPILGENGLSYRFRTVQTDKISVTCILSHRDGHSEENTLAGPADTTGSKNAIQAIGSTLTYLQRYSLVQALGLAAGDDDNGAAAGAAVDTISDEQRDVLLGLIETTGADIAKFCRFMNVEALPEILASQFGKAKLALEAKTKKAPAA